MSQTAAVPPAPAAPSSASRRRLGPYSRALRRGAIGGSLDGRSTTGRLIRDMERQLTEHLGGKPSFVQKLLIERVIRVRLQLDALEAKLASGTWTDHDGRTFGGLQNAFRLGLRELGLAAAVPRKRTIAEYLAEAEDAPP